MRTTAPLALLILACSTALAIEPAQTSDAKAPVDSSDKRDLSFKLTPHAAYTFDADFKDGGGSTSVFRGGAEFAVIIPAGKRGDLSISLDAEYSRYHFKDATGFGAGGAEPIDSTYEYELNLNYSRQIDDKWSFFVAGGLNASGQQGADFGESLTYGGGGGFSYRVSDTFQIGLGAVVRTRLEDSAYVMPLPLITWNINEQWEFTTRYRNIRMNFKPCDQWMFFAAADFASHEYRLDQDAGVTKGVFRDRSIPITIGATFSPSKTFSITAGAGLNVWRQFTIDDKDGNRIARTKSDPSPLLYLNATIKF